MLVGRGDEIRQLETCLAGARANTGSSLILHGDPGIGKTALLDHVVTRASGFVVLRAQPLQAESELPFAGLSDLLRPLVHLVAQLPAAQADALSGALALGPATPGDRFAAAVATMSVLALSAIEVPTLAIVDDAHWLDRPSREALLFAGRRIAAERVVLLLATRTRPWLRDTHIDQLEVQPLPPRTAAQLVELSDGGIAATVRDRLVKEAHGNPLLLLESLSMLADAQRQGEISEHVHQSRDLPQALASHIARLPERTRRALLIAASSIAGHADEIARGLELTGLEQADLAPALEAGLIAESAGMLNFRHPLLRSAVSELARPAEIRQAHRIMADAVTTERPDEAAWHLAGAAEGPDERAARALERAAESAHRRRGYAAAATALSVAARLSPADSAHLRRATGAANAFRLAGHAQDAGDVLASVIGLATDPIARADLQLVHGAVLFAIRPVSDVFALLVKEAELVESHDSIRASRLFAMAAVSAIGAADAMLALDTANRAVACAGTDPSAAFVAALTRAVALTLVGRVREGRSTLTPLLPALKAFDPLSEAGVVLPMAAHTLIWSQDWAEADDILDRALATAREAGALTVLPHSLAVLSELQLRRGQVAAGYAAASESVQIARETGMKVDLTLCLTALARAEALLGRDADCRDHIRIALDLARPLEMTPTENYANGTLGMLELSRGRPDRAVAHLAESASLERRTGFGLPDLVRWSGDLIDAYLGLGLGDLAAKELHALEEQAHVTGSLWAAATAARYRAAIAPDEDYEALFTHALKLHDEREPFETARTVLSLGRRRRRSRRRTAARSALRDALARFEALGAEPWAEQTRAELRVIGDAPKMTLSTALTGPSGLTAQELQVALLVAEGATNTEVGWKLFISPKTVEFHLSHVYRKLGLRSRTELAHRLVAKT